MLVSGFHACLHRLDHLNSEAVLRAGLRAIHAGSRGAYGRLRTLCARAHAVGYKCVARLMREEGL
ncbi:MAG: IS3 family transposase [Xanthomonadaceae bacterium]|jgi:hypothetical protein|nr:IS3 family transposase [Xanthomonadaceae bacterium]